MSASRLNRLQGKIVARHLETTNILFCDGHVKAMQPATLLGKSTTPPTWSAWSTATNRAGLRYFTAVTTNHEPGGE